MARLFAVVVVAGTLLGAAPASAAPPPNDARASAQALGRLPASVRGTTVEATLEAAELGSSCTATKNSVWFTFTAPSNRSVLIALDAAGDLDATIDVYERQRSQVSPVVCRDTNRHGAATLDIDASSGTSYYIRVGARENSADARFSLQVVVPEPPASYPGRQLPRKGAQGVVDRLANADDAWAVRVRRGQTYRLNFVSSGGRCAVAELYDSAGSFGSDPVRRLRCDDYTVFVPSASATYSVLVRAPRASRQRLSYRLRVGRAQADDTAPGLRLANDTGVRGRLRGSELDALDLYRFTIATPSLLRLRLGTGRDFDLRLLTDSGRRIACSCRFAGSKLIERRIKPGRYFAAIRARNGADGRYRLRRLTRAITHARMLVNGSRAATVAPGAGVTLDLAVRPAVSGPARLVIERFDPLAGWLFHSSPRPHVVAGHARLRFTPPSVGRWRVSGEFLGSRRAAPSEGGTVRVTAQEPLED
ncbi:MAG TPA: hypothetical protein VFM58_08215 [Solirubrobacteraceae bacterium]|nr:hypothetical protein [Solirubrobacteraceae bacterium]